MPITLQTMIFRYNYKSNDVFIHLIHYEVYLTALKKYNLRTFTWFVHFELPSRLKGTEKIHTERFSKFPSNIYTILFAHKRLTLHRSGSTNVGLSKVGQVQTSDFGWVWKKNTFATRNKLNFTHLLCWKSKALKYKVSSFEGINNKPKRSWVQLS